jgi:hypothetical protein
VHTIAFHNERQGQHEGEKRSSRVRLDCFLDRHLQLVLCSMLCIDVDLVEIDDRLLHSSEDILIDTNKHLVRMLRVRRHCGKQIVTMLRLQQWARLIYTLRDRRVPGASGLRNARAGYT